MSAQLLKVGNTYNLKRNYWLCDDLLEIGSPNPGDLALTYDEEDNTKTKLYIYSGSKQWKEYGEGNVSSSGESSGAGLSEEEIKALILENTNELCFQLVDYDMENETITLKYTPEEIRNKLAEGKIGFFVHRPCDVIIDAEYDEIPDSITIVLLRLDGSEDPGFTIEAFDNMKYGEVYPTNSHRISGAFYFNNPNSSNTQIGDVYTYNISARTTSAGDTTETLICSPQSLNPKFENLQSQIDELTKKIEELSNS